MLKINKNSALVLAKSGNKHYTCASEMLPDKSVSEGGIGFWHYLHESKQIKSERTDPEGKKLTGIPAGFV